jgi:hypothetical protein
VKAKLGLSLIMALASAWPAFAHHSEAAFDTETVIAFRGTVDRFAWRNPHVYIYVTTEDSSGAPVAWEIETGATPIMSRSGWSPQSLTVGETVTVRAHPLRNPAHKYGILLSLQKEDGVILRQNPADTAAARATSIAGVWRGREATIGPIYEQLGNLALTEKGAAAKAEYDFFRDNPVSQCVGPPTPAILGSTALFLAEIELLDDRIVMRYEFFDAERTIYMDGRPHPENGPRTNQGHSIGWWEGDVLVVDTTLFADHRTANGEGVPGGAERHVIERYRLSEDGTRLLIDFVLEDPEYLAAPLSSSVQWEYAPDLELFRYGCEPDVSRQYTLRGE